ncbi:hypothetical protein AAG906_035870 [Vitis piasezkii]
MEAKYIVVGSCYTHLLDEENVRIEIKWGITLSTFYDTDLPTIFNERLEAFYLGMLGPHALISKSSWSKHVSHMFASIALKVDPHVELSDEHLKPIPRGCNNHERASSS